MDVNSIINNLATKFGTTAQYLIGEMQKYYIIESSISTFVGLVITLVSAFVMKKLITKGLHMKEEDGEWSDWEVPMIWSILPAGFLLGGGIGFIVSIKRLLLWTITPTASVLHEVLKMLSK